jgi:FkbM family methyltransferase
MNSVLTKILSRIHGALPQRIRRVASPLQPVFWKLVSLSGERIVTTPWGAKMHADNSQREFRFSNGTYEEELVNEIEQKSSGKNIHVADIGANVGYFTLLFNNVLKEGEVDAFEPFPPALERLKSNLDLNDESKISVYSCALTSSVGEIQLTKPDDANLGMATISGESGTQYTVSARTLDDVYQGDRSPDLMKVDIEGAELELIRGGTATLPGVETLILELHGGYLKSDEVEEIFRLLSDTGFSEATIIETKREIEISDIPTEMADEHTLFWIE